MQDVLVEWRPVVNEAIERLLPRVLDEAYLAEFFGEASYSYHSAGIQRALADPIWDLLDSGGKRWRAVLFLVFVEALGEDPEEYLPYACVPEILHNGTIIVDDVEDEARKRRGEPALHHQHGVDIALNAGNAMYFIPLKVIDHNSAGLNAEGRLAAYEMLTHELNRTHLGQGMDICWHNEQEVVVDEEQYFEMCACKTGCLTRIVARLGEILWAADNDQSDILEAIEIMQAAGSVEYARERARDLAARARSHLDGLDLESGPEDNLREFSRFVVERRA